MSKLPPHEVLERIFSVIIEEAKTNSKFAKKLVGVLPKNTMAIAERPKVKPNKIESFNPKDYHAVNILRTYDEGVLRGMLQELTKDKLRKVAAFSGLVLTGSAAKKAASKADIIEGIVVAAEQYIKQRKVAAA